MFDALKNCFDSGGHLPTHQEYMVLVQSGLPNDSTNAYIWTSDYHNGAYVGIIRWTGTNPDFTGYHSTYMSWSTHAVATIRPFRPVYHPIDEEYYGPADNLCVGGRFEVSKDLGNGKSIKIWTDSSNRAAATYQQAISVCYGLGGHLASRRDLVELLANGLPNRADTWVWTSDKASYYQIEVIKLLENLTNYADQSADTNYSAEVTHNTSSTGIYSYRCVWTNEVRIR
jgi:hypothetical protein